MPKQSRFAVAIMSVIASAMGTPTNVSDEPCQDLTSVDREEAPWKVRLYDANKDRRAARKKRAKKIGRRR